jgi:hypothetical protein
VSFFVFVFVLFCLRENGRMSLLISQYVDTIERLEDRVEYLEESLYKFY